MDDEQRTNGPFMEEISALRRRISELEKALAASDERFRLITENVDDVIWTADLNMKVTYVSPSVERVRGFTVAEALAQGPEEMLEPDSLRRAADALAAELAAEKKEGADPQRSKTVDLEFVCKDGSTYLSEVNVRFLRDADGKPVGILGVGRDVRERREAERALRESEERFRELAELLPATIFEMEPDGRLGFVNRAGFRLFEYDPADLAGRLMGLDLIAPEDREDALRNVKGIFQGERPERKEYVAMRKDGTAFPGLFGVAPIVRNGKKMGLRGFVIDISERRRLENALRESEAKYRQLVDHAPTGIYEVDFVRGKIINVNDMICEYTGYTREELLSMSPMDLLAEGSKTLFAERLRKIFAGEPVPETVEFHARGKYGREFWVLLRSRFTYEAGKIRGATAIIHDISERKRMEAELLRAQKMESIGVLAGGIAHDFNNILGVLQGNLSLAKVEAKGAGALSGYLDAAEKAVARATALTRQLLTFSKGGAPVKEMASLREVLRETAAFALRGSDVRCDFDLAPDLWPAEVDVGQINQVIHNLIINADHAMPAGGTIAVEARNLTLNAESGMPLKSGNYIEIVVRDGGIGIRPEHLPRIFDPYFSTKAKGSGLGLAAAYSIVKNHDGFIRVDSTPGVGTTFQVYLPASRGGKIAIPAADPGFLRGRGRLLVMDDEEMIRKVVSQMLDRLGYEVTVAGDGQEAISLYREAQESGNPFDAVILDLTVPGGKGGAEAFRQLREIDPRVKGIVSSGYSNDPVLSRYREYGFRGAACKPYRLEELGKVVREALEPAGA